MWQIIGIAGVFAAIGVGYTIAGGKFGVILNAAGPELLIIGGSGIMTLLIANEIVVVRNVMKVLKRAFTGPQWRRSDYADALCLMFLLVRVLRQEGNVALERHIENPSASPIFSRYPRLLADPTLVSFIADVLRSVTLNVTDPHTVGEMMESEIRKRHTEELRAAKALNTVADAFPALGIVAAVLGVIKAMGAISESPEILGHMIGSALVGTFLGVFLAYALVGPIAARMKGVIEEEGTMLPVIRQVILSHLEGLAPQLSVEVARKLVPSRHQPSFDELDRMMNETAKSVRTAKAE
ncbi:Motility protein A (plasmid) [Rhodovastum atsumiense]|uniref:flagellar motor stator protein MotA n=1 Tax=Rhodovastum atsumiense TaxID=504468 RepID=UPI0020246110|nr:flagellar motor stator protein MotA [Rhodovastum atsumiense]CAH2605444.1 Motility protein A [Rhodovastum atsumiense]